MQRNSEPETVWFVDDLPENLEKFRDHHEGEFRVETFSEIGQVERELQHRTPDALLCDVFFYETLEQARRIEEQVRRLADELRKAAEAAGACEEAHLAGIRLIERLKEEFSKAFAFPVYAYTSKGAYLLGASEWERIERASGIPLLKGRYNPATERMRIRRDIEMFRCLRDHSK